MSQRCPNISLEANICEFPGLVSINENDLWHILGKQHLKARSICGMEFAPQSPTWQRSMGGNWQIIHESHIIYCIYIYTRIYVYIIISIYIYIYCICKPFWLSTSFNIIVCHICLEKIRLIAPWNTQDHVNIEVAISVVIECQKNIGQNHSLVICSPSIL